MGFYATYVKYWRTWFSINHFFFTQIFEKKLYFKKKSKINKLVYHAMYNFWILHIYCDYLRQTQYYIIIGKIRKIPLA